MCFSGIILSLAFFIGGLVYLVNNLSVAQKENITCKVMGLGKRKIKVTLLLFHYFFYFNLLWFILSFADLFLFIYS